MNIKVLLLIVLVLLSKPAWAGDLALVSDPEVEDMLLKMTLPIFEAANLNKSDIKIHLINSEEINAFVTDDCSIFVNLGLISEMSEPSELIGVLAHEVAHVFLNHHNKRAEEINDAITKSVLPSIVLSRISQYSIMQEHAADKAAVIFLKKLGISTSGLINALKTIRRSHLESEDQSFKTHPSITERINYLASIEISNSNKMINSKSFIKNYNMMLAKVRGFLWDFKKTLLTYAGNSKYDLYAISVAYYKKHEINKSLIKIDKLISYEPNNPYFYEFKAQIILESGNIEESIKLYTKSHELLPQSNLIKKELINSLLLSEKVSSWVEAENLLLQFKKEDEDCFILENFGIIKAKFNKHTESYLYFAKAALKRNDRKTAKHFLKIAINHNKKSFNKYLEKEIQEVAQLAGE